MRPDHAETALQDYLTETGYRVIDEVVQSDRGLHLASKKYINYFLWYLPDTYDGNRDRDNIRSILDFVLRRLPGKLLLNTGGFTSDWVQSGERFVAGALEWILEFLNNLAGFSTGEYEYLDGLVYCSPPITGPGAHFFRDLALFFFAKSHQFSLAKLKESSNTVVEELRKKPDPHVYTLIKQKRDMETMIRILYECDIIEQQKGIVLYEQIHEFYLQFGYRLFEPNLYSLETAESEGERV
jgi:hypothetical protein